MKKSMAVISGCLIGILLSGCQKNNIDVKEDNNTIESNTEIVEDGSFNEEGLEETSLPILAELNNGDRITQRLTDEITLDVNVEIPDEGIKEISFCKVLSDGFSGDEQLVNLIGHMPETVEMYGDLQPGLAFKEPWQPGSTFMTYLYEGDIGSSSNNMEGIILTSNHLRYQTNHWEQIFSSFPVFSYNGEMGFYTKPSEENFSFADRKEAEEACKQFLQETIGLGEIQHLKTYGFNYEQLQEYEAKKITDSQNMTTEAKPEDDSEYMWSEEDDCYWMFYEQIFEGVPILSNQITRQDMLYIPYCDIQMGYTKNGVEYASVGNHFKLLSKEEVELLPLEQIVESLKNKFEMTFIGNKVITEMKLIYYPLPTGRNADGLQECDMIPTWQFGIEETIGDNTFMTRFYVDARNGTEIVG